jgi:triacylglycerol lipase
MMVDRDARAPIVLVPGLLGFDRVTVGPYTVARYFPEIEETLAAAGYRVGTAKPALTAGITHRAGQLRDYIAGRFPNEPVHIVAHSMGGLDARYMISRLGMDARVRSLTTVGTPHWGSTFADWAVGRFGRVLRPILQFLRIPTDAFRDLMTDPCARFNERVPDAPGVAYHSVAGRCERAALAPFWWPAARVVSHEGPNDGVVSVRSATYGQSCEIWDGDHMHLVNRPNPRGTGWGHRPTDYLRLVRRVEP